MVESTAAFLVRAGFLVVWLPLDTRDFRLVLARGWHGPLPSQGTPGTVRTSDLLYLACGYSSAHVRRRIPVSLGVVT